VPDQYQKTKLREEFLIYDSIDDDDAWMKDEFLCLLRVGIWKLWANAVDGSSSGRLWSVQKYSFTS